VKKGRNSGGGGVDDPEVWQIVARSVKAYPGSGTLSRKGSSAPGKAAAKKRPAPKTNPERGKSQPEGRLDLHGMTQEEAFNALHRFLRRAVAEEKKNVLVITGKGLREGGVLKRLLPLWLEDPALGKNIRALETAAPKDGGSGAFYIRLRKPGRKH